jgi:group II intron reverse transcriptase/maturase
MAAAKIVLEPIFEADFLPTSYGFRPGLSAHHALETIRQTVTWRGKQWALDADIRSCFDEIDHDALLGQIERRVCDRRMHKLLGGWLRAGVFEGGIVSAIEAGTPQGSPISPLLANIALHVLDEAWAGGGHRLGELVKYADDLVILSATREQADEARELVAAVLDELGLRLHPEKTRIAHLSKGAGGLCVSGVRASDARVVEAAGSVVSAQVAVTTGDGLDQRQDPRPHGPPLRRAAVGMGRRGPQPRAARVG